MPTIVPETTAENPARLIDHTLLRPQASQQQIEQLCEDAVEWNFAAVCIPPVFASRAVACLLWLGDAGGQRGWISLWL